MFSWACTNLLKQQKQPLEGFRKKGDLKNSQENTYVGASLVPLESTGY